MFIPFRDAKVILTVRDTDENWFDSWYKFHLKMYEDVNRANGGLFRSYGTWFLSIGLSGQKWKTHMKVGKLKITSLFRTPGKLTCPASPNFDIVQRWYSGIFGVGTMNWFTQSNSMHTVWELNQDLMKQKYRMHNLYVQVSSQTRTGTRDKIIT